jgi:hypothetical protein
MDSSFALMHWLVVMAVFISLFMACLYVVVGIPAAHILYRTGNSRWWSLLIFFPIVNVIGFWIFAFTRWPAIDSPQAP